MIKKRLLVLEDGTIFEGIAFGSEEASIGETVFTTGMTGYQETISNIRMWTNYCYDCTLSATTALTEMITSQSNPRSMASSSVNWQANHPTSAVE